MPEKKQANNLITEYIEASTRGGRLFADELRELNRLTGKNIAQSRIRQYERGEFTPQIDLINHMLPIVLNELLTEAGLTPGKIKKIIKACHIPPKRKQGD
jgi:transcriptional regulator with XRE-family HTH domain